MVLTAEAVTQLRGEVDGDRSDVPQLGQRPDGKRLVERAGTDRRDAARLQEDLNGGRDVVFGRGDHFRYRLRTLRDCNVELVNSAATTNRSGELDSGGWLALGWTADGGVGVGVGPVRVVTEPGIPVLFPTERPFAVVTPAGMHHIVRLDRAFVDTVDAVLSHSPVGSTVFRATPSPESLAHLRASIHAVAAAAFGDGDPEQTRLSLQVQLAEAVLRSFGGHEEGRSASAGLSTVAVARAYLAEHCGAQVTLTDLCRATGVSARTLQTAFLHHTDSTPMAYLQQMRLDRVRIALQLADPGSVAVATIARAWGFRHMGRFAGTYLQRFGEYPGQTLRAAPPRQSRSRAGSSAR